MGMFTHARADVQICASMHCIHACICPEERGAGRVTLAASRLTTPSTTELFSHNRKGRQVGTDPGHVAVGPVVVVVAVGVWAVAMSNDRPQFRRGKAAHRLLVSRK